MIFSFSICGGLTARSTVMFIRVLDATWVTSTDEVRSAQAVDKRRRWYGKDHAHDRPHPPTLPSIQCPSTSAFLLLLPRHRHGSEQRHGRPSIFDLASPSPAATSHIAFTSEAQGVRRRSLHGQKCLVRFVRGVSEYSEGPWIITRLLYGRRT